MIAPLDGRRSSGYGPTGALVAAATTSLPETPGGERNWDYRYTWIRDATFMLWGLYTLGFEWEANDFFYFLADVAEAEPDDLQIMYGIGGERELPEQELGHLSGYEGARPVRIGNGAYDQSQHDVWGAILDSFYLHTKSRDYLPERIWPILVKQVERAIERWRQPDRGIWEVRGEPRPLHVLQADVLGRRRPRRAPRGDSRGPRVRGALAVGRGGDQGRRRAVSASTRRRPGRRRADRLPRQSQGSSAGSATGPPSRPRANGPLRRATTDPVRAPTPMAPRAGPAAVQRRVSA